LTRELTFVIEANNYRWAARMKRLLLETRKQVANSAHKCLSADAYLKLTKRYRVILARGAKELPPIPPRQDGKRGRVAKSDAHNLWERLARHEAAVLLFAKRSEVAFTNNRAERDLRQSQGQAKGLRLLPHPAVRRGLLPYLQLPPDHGLPRIQSTGGHSDGAVRGALRGRG